MPPSAAERVITALFETEETKGYVSRAIESVAPLFIGLGAGPFVPFMGPLIIAGLTSHLLPKVLKVAGETIEIAHEQLQQYEKKEALKPFLLRSALLSLES